MNESATPTFLELAAPGIAGLEPYQPGKPLEALAREYGVRDAVKLASNENPLGPSPRALEAARAALRQVSRYPEGGGEQLKAALGHRHGVEPRCITLGNGSNDVLELLARVFLTPDHAAVLSEHAFAVYPIVTQATGAEARVASAQGPDAAMPNGHDLEAMAARVTDRTRVVFVANPNNPTGTWLDAGALEAFVAALPSHAIAVIDEAYFEYVETPGYPDAVKWLERYPNLVVTRTFSKVYGLAGLRVGYAVSHPEVADLMNRVRQPFNVNAVGQAAALEALDDREHLERSRTINREGMEQITAGLRDRGLSYIPSVANFVAFDVERAAAPVYEALLREGVIVRPIGGYGLPRHLRVTIGTHAENARFLEALDRVLR